MFVNITIIKSRHVNASECCPNAVGKFGKVFTKNYHWNLNQYYRQQSRLIHKKTKVEWNTLQVHGNSLFNIFHQHFCVYTSRKHQVFFFYFLHIFFFWKYKDFFKRYTNLKQNKVHKTNSNGLYIDFIKKKY